MKRALMAAWLLAGCAQGAEREAKSSPTPTPVAVDPAQVKANELGLVMILEYHRIGPKEERWQRTPANFRADLERLYQKGYVLVNLQDFVSGTMQVPAGKKPVILTFDDGTEGQFRYLPDGKLDPHCAVGILEEMYQRHPDFGRAGTFYQLPRLAFEQPGLAEKKLRFLVDNGYEIGNHTVDHTDLTRLGSAQVQKAVGDAAAMVAKIIPGYQVKSLAYPYGGVPKDLEAVAKGPGYTNTAALLVGADPAPSPFSKKFQPLKLPRIQAIQSELDRWFLFFEQAPHWQYISDGDSNRISAAKNLPEAVKQQAKAGLTVNWY